CSSVQLFFSPPLPWSCSASCPLSLLLQSPLLKTSRPSARPSRSSARSRVTLMAASSTRTLTPSTARSIRPCRNSPKHSTRLVCSRPPLRRRWA
ncbi:hypothetical protein BGZ81_005279, partial [Podila clonocystis]